MTPTTPQIIFEPPLRVVRARVAESRRRSVRRHNVQALEIMRRRENGRAMTSTAIKVVAGVCAFLGALDILRLFV